MKYLITHSHPFSEPNEKTNKLTCTQEQQGKVQRTPIYLYTLVQHHRRTSFTRGGLGCLNDAPATNNFLLLTLSLAISYIRLVIILLLGTLKYLMRYK